METTASLWCEWEVRLMGRSHRPRPRRLGKKLREIRKRLEMSQVKMCEELDFPAIHPDSLGILVADVAGHGVPAALVASMVKTAVTTQTGRDGEPAKVIAGLNSILCREARGQ